MLHRSALRLRKTGLIARIVPDTVPGPMPSSISPSPGSITGLSTVTITGEFFLNENPGGGYPVYRVTFDDVPGTNLVVVSDTQITCTTPSGVTSNPVVRVFGPGGDRCVPRSFIPIFDPATLPLTLWQRRYGGAPWVGTASAGPSGSNDLTTSGTDPTVGALDGHGTATCDGATESLLSSLDPRTLFTSGAGTIVAFFNVASAHPDSGAWYEEPAFLCTHSTQEVGLQFSDAGLILGNYDGASFNRLAIACSTGAWHVGTMTWDGAELRGRVDQGAFSTLASGPTSLTADTVHLGVSSFAGNFLDGQIAEVFAADSVLSDADLNHVYSYLKATYPSAGLP